MKEFIPHHKGVGGMGVAAVDMGMIEGVGVGVDVSDVIGRAHGRGGRRRQGLLGVDAPGAE